MVSAMMVGLHGLKYLYQILFANLLGPESYGDFVITIDSIYMMAMVSLFGSDKSIIKLVPEYLVEKQWGYLNGYLKYVVSWLAISGVFVIFLWLANIISMNYLIEFNYYRASNIHIVWFFIWLIPFFAIIRFCSQLLRTIECVFVFVLTSYIAGYAGPMLVTAILAFFGIAITINNILIGLAFFSLLVIGLQFLLFYSEFPMKIFSNTPKYNRSLWNSVALNNYLSNLMKGYFYTCCLIILEIFGNNEANVSIFASVIVVAKFVFIGIDIMSGTNLVKISTAVAEKDTEKLQKLLNLNIVVSLLIGISAATILLFWGKPILTVLGPKFDYGYNVLVLVAFINITGVMVRIYKDILLVSEYYKSASKITIIEMLIVLVMGVILVRKIDMLGIVISIGVSALFSFICLAYLCKYRLALKPFYFK